MRFSVIWVFGLCAALSTLACARRQEGAEATRGPVDGSLRAKSPSDELAATLASRRPVSDYQVVALGAIPSLCNPGGPQSFYSSGAIKSCVLRDFYPSNGVTCNKYGPVGFFESGKLESCILTEFVAANGVRCNKYGPVGFFESGKLRRCVLVEAVTINGQPCNPYGPISFYEDGNLASCIKPTK